MVAEFVLLAMASAASPAQERPANSAICVTVIDDAEHRVSGASVSVQGLLEPGDPIRFTTDKSGRGCSPPLAEGLYAVGVSKIGRLSVRYWPVRVTFPLGATLSFRMPIGEVSHELYVDTESRLSGTLLEGKRPASKVEICLLPGESARAQACYLTNDLGQYAFIVPPGIYWAEYHYNGRAAGRQKVDLSSPAIYRGLLRYPDAGGKP